MATTAKDTAQQPAQRANFMTVLRRGDFRNLWLGQVVSQVGDYFTFLALMVVVSGFAKDPESTTLAVSGMMISFTLPRLLFGLVAGVFVDRWDRRRTMLVSDLIRMVLTLGLIPAFLAQSLWALYAIGFVLSAFGTLFSPAKGALIPRLVPQNELMAANSLSQTTQMLATLIGPALAGFTFYAVGNGNQWIAFVIDSLSYAASALAIFMIRVPAATQVERSASETASVGSGVRQVGRELLVGLRTLVLNRSITTVAVVLGVTMLGVGAVNVLWLVLLKERFAVDGGELALRVSILDTVFAGGMIAASILIGNFLAHVAPKWLIMGALGGAGIGIAMFGYLPEYWQMVASMVVVGFFVAPLNAATSTLIQLLVPNEQLGRVGGGISMVVDTATLGSMSLAGVLGAALGVPTVFLLAGVMCLGGCLLAWALLPGVKAAAPAPSATGEETQRADRSPANLAGAATVE